MYSVYQLSSDERKRLLSLFPPRYSDVYADHVTVQFGGSKVPVPPQAEKMEIIGRADDNHGLEALVVRINGNLKRSDNKIYHITWSLNSDMIPTPDISLKSHDCYRPVLSNVLVCGLIDTDGNRLEGGGWSFVKYGKPIPFRAEPKVKYTTAELARRNIYTNT